LMLSIEDEGCRVEDEGGLEDKGGRLYIKT
jgi:hypothetical protein